MGIRDGSSGTRRGGLTNLSFVAADDDEEVPLDFEVFDEEEGVSNATSLERRRAVFVALVVSKASAAVKISRQNIPVVFILSPLLCYLLFYSFPNAMPSGSVLVILQAGIILYRRNCPEALFNSVNGRPWMRIILASTERVEGEPYHCS